MSRSTRTKPQTKSFKLLPAQLQSTSDRIVFGFDEIVRKNERHRAFKPPSGPARIILSASYRRWRKKLAAEILALGVPKLVAGAWRLTVITVCGRRRHLDIQVPLGDSDSVISGVKDTLEFAEVLDNDARIVEDRTYTVWRKGKDCFFAVLDLLPNYDIEAPTEILLTAERQLVKIRQESRSQTVSSSGVQSPPAVEPAAPDPICAPQAD